jgi:hypothetical protein
MEVTIKGIEEASGFQYSSITFKLTHNILVTPIPGKGHKDLTVRTTDVKSASTGPLWTAAMEVPCVYEDQVKKMKQMAELGGPYVITCALGTFTMYITDSTFNQSSGFIEPGTTGAAVETIAGVKRNSFYSTWSFTLFEKGGK